MNARWIICDVCSERAPQHKFTSDRKVNGELRTLDLCGHCMDQLSKFIDAEREKLVTRLIRFDYRFA